MHAAPRRHCELTTGLAADPRLDERIFFNWRGPEQIIHFFLVRRRLPLPLWEGGGGWGLWRTDPSPQPPPTRGGEESVSCELTTGLAADPRLDERIFFN